MKGLFVAWGCSSFCFSAPGWLVAHADHVCSCAMLCFGFLQLWTMKKFARPLLQPQTRRSSKCEVMWPNLVKPSEPLRPPWRCGVLDMVWWCGLLLDNTMCSGTGRNAAQCDERSELLDRIAPPRKARFGGGESVLSTGSGRAFEQCGAGELQCRSPIWSMLGISKGGLTIFLQVAEAVAV